MNINIQVDKEIKEEAENLFTRLGLDINTAINMFLVQCIKRQEIPFKIKKPKYSRSLRKALREAKKMEKHPEKYKSYDNVDELFNDLEK